MTKREGQASPRGAAEQVGPARVASPPGEALRQRARDLEVAMNAMDARLGGATAGETERDLRRAALNVMEDALAARRAAQVENEERRRVEAELREADRRKDEFLATLAHELRGPLAPVRNGLGVLRRSEVDEATRERLLAIMDKQVSHMARLVEDLLDVSRITRGRVELRPEPTDLRAVIQRSLEATEAAVRDAGHTVEIDLPAEPVVLQADPVRLAQVMTNLLSNAVKYTRAAGKITLSARLAEGAVVIRVADTGLGIPAPMLQKVFDLFTQVDRTYDRARGGLGIGLTLAKSLVELHGGSIDAASDGAGHGSVFTVRLPLADPAVPVPAPSTTRLERLAEDARRERVLVVDDDVDSAQTLELLIETIGHEVTCAHHGVAALEAIETFRPTVVLLDIGMPGMDGYEVARCARQLEAGRAATLIALTGWGQREDRERTRAAGFAHHLVKPVAVETLESVLESVPALAQSRLASR